jgi:DNA-binding LytR/AlgR family response regulator
MIRCLIVDDEPLARQLMESHVRQVKTLELIAVCESAMEAFEWIHKTKIDLLFLDIQMPGINGLNFFKSLKNPPKVIFTTAFMEHAVEAFEIEAVDYILKPVTFERFMKAVQKIIPASDGPSTSVVHDEAIFIKVDKRLTRIEHKDIIYVEGYGDYIKIITPAITHVTYSSLNKMEELLPATIFLRIHKSYIINIRHIQFVDGNLVRIHDQELPVGNTYKSALYSKIGAE